MNFFMVGLLALGSVSAFAQTFPVVGTSLVAKVNLSNTKKNNTVYVLDKGTMSSNNSYVKIPDEFKGWIMGVPGEIQVGDEWIIRRVLKSDSLRIKNQTTFLLTSKDEKGFLILESADAPISDLESIFEIVE